MSEADLQPKKLPWLKFYPTDWLGDFKLRQCSPASRALWIDCICFMHEGDPYGHLTIKGRAMTPAEVGQGTGQSWRTIEKLLAELEGAGVCSRTPHGVLYSRRMVKDAETRQRRAAGGHASLNNPNVPRPKSSSDEPRKDTSKDILDDVLTTQGDASGTISIKDSPRYQRLVARDQSTTTTERSASEKRRSAANSDPRVERVLAHYVETHPKRRPGAKAKLAVIRALRTYSPEELIEAINGNAGDAWHCEKGKHELDYVLRDNEKIDSFRLRPAPRDWSKEKMTDEMGHWTPTYHEWMKAGCP
jgi:hypothetical protein